MQHVRLALFRIQVAGCFERQPGADRARAVSEQNRCVVKITAIACFDRQPNVGAHTSVHQGVVYRARE